MSEPGVSHKAPERPPDARWLWGKWTALAAGVAAGAVVVYRNAPSQSGIYPPCVFHWLTGLHCPGCGTGRGLHALLHGDVAGALDLNPLMVVALPVLVYCVVKQAVWELAGCRLPGVFLRASWIWTLLVLILVYWVARNIPYPPFEYLAP